MKNCNISVPNVRCLETRRREIIDPLFAWELAVFEEGTKKNRSEVEHSLAYCKSIVEIDSLVRRENDYDSSHPLRCKLGLDKGQGFLKLTAQYMEIAYNSIKTTLILAASPCIETHNNLSPPTLSTLRV